MKIGDKSSKKFTDSPAPPKPETEGNVGPVDLPPAYASSVGEFSDDNARDHELKCKIKPETYHYKKVAKVFKGESYPGVVDGHAYDDDDGIVYYQIVYEDDDREDVNILELLDMLL